MRVAVLVLALAACGGGGGHGNDLAATDMAARDSGPSDDLSSSDAASSSGWIFLDDTLRGGSINAVASHPQNASLVWITVNSSGIFKSVDGGAHFAHQPTTSGFTTLFGALAVDPNNQSAVYAATTGGIVGSRDGGATWTLFTNGAAPMQPNLPFVDGNGAVWVGGTNGISELPAGSTTWVTPPQILGAVNVVQFATDKLGNLWAAYDYNVAKFNGTTWTVASTGLPAGGHVSALALDPSNVANAYVQTSSGFYKTTTGGASWVAAGTGLSNVEANGLVVDPTAPQRLYIVTDKAYVSTDSGATFNASTSGFVGGLGPMAIDSAGSVYVGSTTQHGLWKTTSFGSSWSVVGDLNAVGSAIASSGTSLYVTAPTGVLASHDNGATFNSIFSGYAYAVAVDPMQPSTILVGTATGVAVSQDSGTTWSTQLTSDLIVETVADPTTSGVFYIYDSTKGVLYVSTDHGATFSPSTSGFPTGSSPRGLTVDSKGNAYTSITTGAAGTYRSTDKGASWTLVDSAATSGVFSAGGVTFANKSNGVLRRSTDGVTWTDVTVSATPDTIFESAAADASGTIYLASFDKGIVRSTDQGLTFTEDDEGVLDYNVIALSAGASGRIWVSTYDGLFYR